VKFPGLFEKKGLSLERLRTLVEVDEAGNIASAALGDESRQSLISRQLTELERFFHTELKRKAGKTIRLTPAGKELAKLARQHLQLLEQFRRATDRQPNEVTIGAGDSLLQWLVLPRLRQVRDVLRGSVLELQDLQNVAIGQALQDHVIDFGLLRSDLVERGSLAGRPLGKFGYSLFIPDRLCPRNKKVYESWLLQELPIATQGGNTLFQRRLAEIAVGRKWKLNVNLFCESFPQAAQVLASGQMAVILPNLARLGVPFDSVWAYPLKSLNELRREVYLAWHPHRLETRPHLAGIADKLASALKFWF
jgi:DNA-binding transcriptional LysR family regulator